MADAETEAASQTPPAAVSLPEIYTDGAQIQITPYTVTMVLTVGQQPKGIVRMNPIYAKTLTILLRKYLKDAEGTWGEPIAVPEVVLKDRDMSLDDW